MNCPSCKSEIEIPRSAAPPTPQVSVSPPPPVSAPKQKINASALIIIGCIAFFALMLIIGGQLGHSPSTATTPVKARVGLTDSAVTVTNLPASNDWGPLYSHPFTGKAASIYVGSRARALSLVRAPDPTNLSTWP